jgi:hypothetical protein
MKFYIGGFLLKFVDAFQFMADVRTERVPAESLYAESLYEQFIVFMLKQTGIIMLMMLMV